MLCDFLNRQFKPVDGSSILYSSFISQFYDYLAACGVSAAEWPRSRIRQALEAEGFVIGVGGSGVVVGNIQANADRKRWVKQPGGKSVLRLEHTQESDGR
jgi:hypothetical protein